MAGSEGLLQQNPDLQKALPDIALPCHSSAPDRLLAASLLQVCPQSGCIGSLQLGILRVQGSKVPCAALPVRKLDGCK